MVIPIFVGRPQSVEAVEASMTADRQLVMVTQTDPRIDEPSISELYRFGVIAEILQVLKLPDGTLKVLIEGDARIKLLRLEEVGTMMVAHFRETRQELRAVIYAGYHASSCSWIGCPVQLRHARIR